MIEQSLLDYFTTHHYPREEVLNRLPFSVSIDEFWPRLVQLRRSRSSSLPLTGTNRQGLWFVMTDSMVASGDRISSMARRDIDRIDPGEDVITEGLIDEAFFSSYLEGASVSRLECRRFLKSGEDPSGVGELLAQNNLSAIRHMAEHRYEPYSSHTLLTWARLLTNLMNGEVEDYRQSNTHAIPGRALTPQPVPPAADIPGMVDSLCLFLNDHEMHPLLKAAIAQAYILLVRPFDEGNERLARLLSYSILLRKGYSFFRQFALSGMIAQDGMLYYKAMETLQDVRCEGDLTCFLEYYLGVLSRSVSGFEAYLAQQSREAEKGKEASAAGVVPSAALTAPENREERLKPAEPKVHQPSPTLTKEDEERNRLLDECSTPEMLVSRLIKLQSVSLKIFETKPYFDKLGLKDKEVLKVIQRLNTTTSKQILAVNSFFHSNMSRRYTCSELAQLIQTPEGTVRRICYIMATLNLIHATHENARGRNHMIRCFYAGDAIAA